MYERYQQDLNFSSNHTVNTKDWILSRVTALHPAYLRSHWLQGWAGPLPHWTKTCQIYNPRLTLSWMFDSVEWMTHIWLVICGLCLQTTSTPYTIVCSTDYYGEITWTAILGWIRPFYITCKQQQTLFRTFQMDYLLKPLRGNYLYFCASISSGAASANCFSQ